MKSYIGGYTVDRRIYRPQRSSAYVPDPNTGKKAKLYVEVSLPHRGRIIGRIKGALYAPKPLVAKIDTGASHTMLKKEDGERLAEQLEIDLLAGYQNRAAFIHQANGAVMVGVKYSLSLYVCKREIKDRPVIFPLRDDFGYNLWLQKYRTRILQIQHPFSRYRPTHNYLGIQDFLDEALISLDSENMYLFQRKRRGK